MCGALIDKQHRHDPALPFRDKRRNVAGRLVNTEDREGECLRAIVNR